MMQLLSNRACTLKLSRSLPYPYSGIHAQGLMVGFYHAEVGLTAGWCTILREAINLMMEKGEIHEATTGQPRL